MNLGRVVKTAVVAGIVFNVVDYIVMRFVLGGFFANVTAMNPDMSMTWNVVIDFLAALVLAIVFDRVRSSFDPGVQGGLSFGLYAGLLVNFPLWMALHFMLKGIGTTDAAVLTVYGLAMWLVLGAASGWAYDLGEAKATAKAMA